MEEWMIVYEKAIKKAESADKVNSIFYELAKVQGREERMGEIILLLSAFDKHKEAVNTIERTWNVKLKTQKEER